MSILKDEFNDRRGIIFSSISPIILSSSSLSWLLKFCSFILLTSILFKSKSDTFAVNLYPASIPCITSNSMGSCLFFVLFHINMSFIMKN